MRPDPAAHSARSPAWVDGYNAGLAERPMAPPTEGSSDWSSGYLIGRRAREDEDLIAAVEASLSAGDCPLCRDTGQVPAGEDPITGSPLYEPCR